MSTPSTLSKDGARNTVDVTPGPHQTSAAKECLLPLLSSSHYKFTITKHYCVYNCGL